MTPKSFITSLLLCAAVAVQAQDCSQGQPRKILAPREWVDVKNGDRTIHCFIVYPEVKNPAPAVLVIHEIFGMTDWVRSAADKFAANGVIAIAPDLLSGMGPERRRFKRFQSRRLCPHCNL